MHLNKAIMTEYATCGSQKFDKLLMAIPDTDQVEKLLLFMLKNSHRTRIERVYGRYSMMRKRNERAMISKGEWYE